MSIKQKSSAAMSSLMKFIGEADTKAAAIGFFSDSQYPDGVPVAYIATIQEFGTDKIPPRPFMRPAMAKTKELTDTMSVISRNVANGKTTYEQGLKQAGFVGEGLVSKAIAAVTSPALAESTIKWRMYNKSKDFNYHLDKDSRRRKPDANVSVKPLVWTARMLQSVASKVIGKGSM